MPPPEGSPARCQIFPVQPSGPGGGESRWPFERGTCGTSADDELCLQLPFRTTFPLRELGSVQLPQGSLYDGFKRRNFSWLTTYQGLSGIPSLHRHRSSAATGPWPAGPAHETLATSKV